MRTTASYLLLIVMLSIVGCNSSSNQNMPANTSTDAAAIDKITGMVTYRQQLELSPQARLDVQLVDVSQAASVVTQKTINPTGQIPIAYELNFDPAKINPSDIYVVRATILDGERRYTHTLQYPALTKGAPAKIDILVNPETTASEKLKADFAKLENLIGGMERVTGQQETPDVMVGWDAFFEGKDLRLIRENTDRGDKGRINSKYGYYKNGQPMAVVREEKTGTASPTLITRVGWSENGELVFKEKSGAQNLDVSDDEAKSLLSAAKQAQATANANVKKKK